MTTMKTIVTRNITVCDHDDNPAHKKVPVGEQQIVGNQITQPIFCRILHFALRVTQVHPTPVQKPHQIRKSAASCCVGVGRHCSEGEEVLNIIKKSQASVSWGMRKAPQV